MSYNFLIHILSSRDLWFGKFCKDKIIICSIPIFKNQIIEQVTPSTPFYVLCH